MDGLRQALATMFSNSADGEHTGALKIPGHRKKAVSLSKTASNGTKSVGEASESTPLSDPSVSGLESEVLEGLKEMGVSSLSACQTAAIHHYLATPRDHTSTMVAPRLSINTGNGTGRTFAHSTLVVDSLTKHKRQDTTRYVDYSVQDALHQEPVLALVICQNAGVAKKVHDVYASLCHGTNITLSCLKTSSYAQTRLTRIEELQDSFAHIVVSLIDFFDIARWNHSEGDRKDREESKATHEYRDEHTDIAKLCHQFFSTVKILVLVGTEIAQQAAWEERLRDFAQDVTPILPERFTLISVSHRHVLYRMLIADWGLPLGTDGRGESCSIIDCDGRSEDLTPAWDLVPHAVVLDAASQANETVAEAFAPIVQRYIHFDQLGTPLKRTILVCRDLKQIYQVSKCQGDLEQDFAKHMTILHNRQPSQQHMRSLRALGNHESSILVTTIQTLRVVSMTTYLAADQVMFLDCHDNEEHLLDDIISAMFITGQLGHEGTARFFFRAPSLDVHLFFDLKVRFQDSQLVGFDKGLWSKEEAILMQETEGIPSKAVETKPKMTEAEAKYLFGFDETE